MKRPSILSGLAFALIATVFAVPVWWGLQTALPFSLAFRLTLLSASLAYCFYLLRTVQNRVGTLSLATANLVIGMVLCCLPVTTPSVAGALAVVITLNRSLLFHRSLIAIAFDGLVSLLGLILGSYLFAKMGSIPAVVWSFFLVQSLFVMIPRRLSEKAHPFPAREDEEQLDPFLRGQRQAEAALKQMMQEEGS